MIGTTALINLKKDYELSMKQIALLDRRKRKSSEFRLKPFEQ